MRQRISRRRFVQAVGALGLASGAGGLGLGGPSRVSAHVTITTRAHELSTVIDGQAVHDLPFSASHVAVYWKGAHDAAVSAAFSADGAGFGAPRVVAHDEVGENKHDGWTYGAVMTAGSAQSVALSADRRLEDVRIVAMVDGEQTVSYEYRPAGDVQAAAPMPAVITRAGWGCDESLMTWAPDFYPVQKLICHHTATQNNDPNPPATVRAIYYYHAVTQGWGDIGYNFLVDESGRIYEGRYSRAYAPGESPTGEDLAGDGVTGAHAYQYNSGTVGIALLGNLVNQDATPAARLGLERMLAWKADRHGIDPNGRTVYTNPVTFVRTTFPDIAGHLDVNSTECPGGAFYATLPTVRNDVASMIGSSGTPAPAVPVVGGLSPSAGPTGGGTAVTISGSGFTGATAVSFGPGNPGTGLRVVSDSQITVTAPGHVAGVVNVTVTAPGGTSAVVAADRFNYTPSVTGLSPASGPAGTTVTVGGSGFTGATAVAFGPTAATGLTVHSDTQLTAQAPAGSGTVHVTVTSGGVTSATSSADQFGYTAAGAPPSFTLAASPPSQTVSRYGTARFGVSLTAVNGFRSPVSLSVSGLPRGASASFSPGSLTPSGSSTLTVNSRGVPGSFTLTITATGGGVTQTARVVLTVTSSFWG